MSCSRIFSFIFLYFIVSFTSSAQDEQASYLGYQFNNHQLTLDTSIGQYQLTFLHDEAIEVLFRSDQQQLPSYAIETPSQTSSTALKDSIQALYFSSKKLSVKINKNPLRLSYIKKGQLLASEASGFTIEQGLIDQKNNHQGAIKLSFKLDETEKILGGGERVLGMDRRGYRLPLYNRAHYGYTTESEQMNFGLPAIMSSKKYLILFDNSAKGMLDIGKTQPDILQFEAIGGRSSYIFFSGDSYPELIKHYVEVTGKQPMPPRWALGNFASRFGYHSEQEAREVVSQYQALDFPLDAIIFDLYWFGKELKGTMGNLDWDRNAFPSPEKMITDFKAKGVKTLLITEPFVLTTSSKWQDAAKNNALALDKSGNPKVYEFYFGETSIIDVFSESGRDWFWQTYDNLLKQGVAAWWGDLGEPEVHPSDTLHAVGSADEIHNVYGHQWAEMIFQRQIAAYPDKRPFMLMRSGFAGSQRFGMFPWTGDVSRSWGGLKPQVELSLQMGLFGLAYTHSDLGGFAGDAQDNELYIRWLQYGVFQPIFRPHAQEAVPSEPIYYPDNVQDIVREFIKLRYKLLPYNYSLAYQNSTSGMPLMRPVFFEQENQANLIDIKDSYFWGDAFFITPITDSKGEGKFKSTTLVNLPNGVWFNFFDDKPYQGGQKVSIENSLKNIPVFVRAGSFVPMIDEIQSTEDYSSEKLNLHYYADNSVEQSQYQMYEDDGKTYQAHLRQQFELLNFSAKQVDNHLTVEFSHQSNLGYQNMPKQREIVLTIHHWQQQPNKITPFKTGGVAQQLTESKSLSALNSSSSAFYYDNEKHQLYVKFNWQHQKLILEIN